MGVPGARAAPCTKLLLPLRRLKAARCPRVPSAHSRVELFKPGSRAALGRRPWSARPRGTRSPAPARCCARSALLPALSPGRFRGSGLLSGQRWEPHGDSSVPALAAPLPPRPPAPRLQTASPAPHSDRDSLAWASLLVSSKKLATSPGAL